MTWHLPVGLGRVYPGPFFQSNLRRSRAYPARSPPQACGKAKGQKNRVHRARPALSPGDQPAKGRSPKGRRPGSDKAERGVDPPQQRGRDVALAIADLRDVPQHARKPVQNQRRPHQPKRGPQRQQGRRYRKDHHPEQDRRCRSDVAQKARPDQGGGQPTTGSQRQKPAVSHRVQLQHALAIQHEHRPIPVADEIVPPQNKRQPAQHRIAPKPAYPLPKSAHHRGAVRVCRLAWQSNRSDQRDRQGQHPGMQAKGHGHRNSDQQPGQRRPDELPGQLFGAPQGAVGLFQLRPVHHRGQKGLRGVVPKNLGAAQKKGQPRHDQHRRGPRLGQQRHRQQGQGDQNPTAIRPHQQGPVIVAVRDHPCRKRQKDPRKGAGGGHQSDQKGIVGQQCGQPGHGHRHHSVPQIGAQRGGEQLAEIAVFPQGCVRHGHI